MKVGKATLTAERRGQERNARRNGHDLGRSHRALAVAVAVRIAQANHPVVAKIVAVAGASVDGLVPKFTSATPAVATVDSNGVVTAVSNGTAKITADVDGQTATVDAVVAQVAATVAVSPRVASVASLSQTAILTATAVDAKANKIDAPKVTWKSADTTIATVSGTGATAMVTPHQAGTTQITATVDGKSDVSTFIVAQMTAMLVIVPSHRRSQLGQSITLSAKFADAGGNPISDVSATFATTTPASCRFRARRATGVAPGVAQISATSGQYTASLSLPVGACTPEMVVFGDAGFMADGAIEFEGADQLHFLDNLFTEPIGWRARARIAGGVLPRPRFGRARQVVFAAWRTPRYSTPICCREGKPPSTRRTPPEPRCPMGSTPT